MTEQTKKLNPSTLDKLIESGEQTHCFVQAETEDILTSLRELRELYINGIPAGETVDVCTSITIDGVKNWFRGKKLPRPDTLVMLDDGTVMVKPNDRIRKIDDAVEFTPTESKAWDAGYDEGMQFGYAEGIRAAEKSPIIQQQLMDLATELARYFTSGNSVAVERATIRRDSDLYLLLRECLPDWKFEISPEKNEDKS